MHSGLVPFARIWHISSYPYICPNVPPPNVFSINDYAFYLNVLVLITLPLTYLIYIASALHAIPRISLPHVYCFTILTLFSSLQLDVHPIFLCLNSLNMAMCFLTSLALSRFLYVHSQPDPPPSSSPLSHLPPMPAFATGDIFPFFFKLHPRTAPTIKPHHTPSNQT